MYVICKDVNSTPSANPLHLLQGYDFISVASFSARGRTSAGKRRAHLEYVSIQSQHACFLADWSYLQLFLLELRVEYELAPPPRLTKQDTLEHFQHFARFPG